jgi:hypothetical protein
MWTYQGQAPGSTSGELFTASAAGSAAASTSQTTPTVTAAAGDLVMSVVVVDASASVARPYYTQSGSGVTKQVDDEGTNNVEVGIADEPSPGGSEQHAWTLATSESPAMFVVAIRTATSAPEGVYRYGRIRSPRFG